MPRRGQRAPRRLPGDPSDPEGLTAWMLRHLASMSERHYSPRTVRVRESALKLFILWCDARGLHRPTQVTLPILQRYRRHLFYYRQKNGKPLTISTQHVRLGSLRAFFKWLTREGVVLSNPASELDLPKLTRGLPKYVLTKEDAEAILAVPDTEDPLGLRDRAILETLYSTGIRRMELVALEVVDLDQSRGCVRIFEGKGRKDRVVPIGERALAWCAKYLDSVRPGLVYGEDTGVLFLTKDGVAITPDRLTQMTRNYVRRADIGKQGACHLFRHAAATLMLENGADVRYIQKMLGHSKLGTTEHYTHVSITKLKEIHNATHPAALLRPRRTRDDEPEDLQEDLTALSP